MAAGLQFSSSARAVGDEDELLLTSVGIDIGSSTTHLVFSSLLLKRRDSRYVVEERKVLHESAIALTPFDATNPARIDGAALGEFIEGEYRNSGLSRAEIDTGALILTGLAVRRENARQIGELFADEAGKFVMVTAGDGLEATMAAHGSGSAALSEESGICVNIDIGGGTTKLALCADGRVLAVSALDVGARLLVFDQDERLTRIEPAAEYLADRLGVSLTIGESVDQGVLDQLVEAMADVVLAGATATVSGLGAAVDETLRRVAALPPAQQAVSAVVFSGGVSEYVYGRETGAFGDLGAPLAGAIRRQIESAGLPIVDAGVGIRATAMGASQYTIQVSGSTIFVDPASVLPLHNVPVVALDVDLDVETIDPDVVQSGVTTALDRATGYTLPGQPVAVAVHWRGSATYARLEALTSGLVRGLTTGRELGDAPIVLVSDGDVGGLLGMHIRQAGQVGNAVVSIDGIELRDFDYVDVGVLIPSSGAVPVVIKSLVFPVPEEEKLVSAVRSLAANA